MFFSSSLAHRVTATAVVLAVSVGAAPGQAVAATRFNSIADVTVTVGLGQGSSWSDLGFNSGSNSLDASAQVATGGANAFQISSVSQSIDRESSPPKPYDVVGLNGGIAQLLFKDGNGSLNYPFARASSSMGRASSIATPSGTGFSFTMNTNVTGEAFESQGYAAASMDWLANTFFTNLTANPLTVVWTVTYTLTSQAHADHPPADNAVVETELFAGIGAGLPCCNPKDALAFSVAGDPPLDPPVSEVPVRPNPDPTVGSKRYVTTLAAGASDQFSLYVTQFGYAQVAHVPEPQTGWLFGMGLGALMLAARRRVA